MTSSSNRTKVFISYSHKDDKYLEGFMPHLRSYERNKQIDAWADKKIKPGAEWQQEIKEALASASVAVLLISVDFVDSQFIRDKELPLLLSSAEKEGVKILPVILRPCLLPESLSRFQAINSPSMPVAKMKGYQREELWVKVGNAIVDAMGSQNAVTSTQKHSEDIGRAQKVDVSPSGHLLQSQKEQILGNDLTNQQNLIMQSVEIWNEWRKQHPDIQPDLSKTNLSKTDLSNADLTFANLEGANLEDTVLRGANLEGANLEDTVLRGANLEGAILSGTNFSYSDLTYADLHGADLRSSDLHGSLLFGANLEGAILSGANLKEANLSEANLNSANLNRVDLSEKDLSAANLSGADLSGANLSGADLYRANLYQANLSGANLSAANLSGANLSFADLSGANLSGANLSGANLSGANLSGAVLVGTNLMGADLSHCSIYGISVWNVELEGARQDALVITSINEPTITVDNLEVAQFIYFLLSSHIIREVVNTITTKVVLILGRFTPERKAVLDALRVALRTHGYLPILFDFEKPSSRSYTETVIILAHLVRFIIADITDPRSIPLELGTIIPSIAVPVQPLILKGQKAFAMFVDFLKRYHWVLPIYYYRDLEDLLTTLNEHIIEPAEQKAKELEKR